MCIVNYTASLTSNYYIGTAPSIDVINVFSVFKPPPPVGAGRGYMFSSRPSVPLSVRPCVRDSRGSFMFPRYLQYLLTDFRQTFVLWCILGHR